MSTHTRWFIILASTGLLSACSTADSTVNPIQAGSVTVKAPVETVKESLRSQGRQAEANTLQTISQVPRGEVTHVRMQQTLDGLRVHGAFVKASVNRLGEVVHLTQRLAPPVGRLPEAAVTERDALAAALNELGYEPADLGVITQVQGRTMRFAQGAVFHRDPAVERVAYLDDSGATRRGFLVETWSVAHNQLDETLVDARGHVVSVEHRTANDRYNVFVEDPLKGGQIITSGPGATTESPAGWLGAGAHTSINISGNNAHAYLDQDANNAADIGGAAVTNGDFLTAADLSVSPKTPGNIAVAAQNLFYLNNVVHDALYRHGFTEAAGNFQANNFGRGGLGNDPVNAEAQDGSGTDNANFSTPNDGSSPRMQMYLWSGAGPNALVTLGYAQYGAYASSFGKALTSAPTTDAPLALMNDGTGTVTDGCETSTVSLSGKLAIVDRGTCNFTIKVVNAQRAGAVGVIIVNNVPGDTAFSAGGTDRKIKISSVMVGSDTGTTLKAQAGALANLRTNPVVPLQIDGDVDADVVFHEYGHGLTWRMIGSMSGAISGAIGEGASDVLAFSLNGDDRIGEYAASAPQGIRRHPYVNYPLTYKDVTGAEVHNDGEIYAAAMWRVRELYLAAGFTADDFFRDFVDGLNYPPPAPTFEQMRDGMVTAATASSRQCLVWSGFASKGIGVGSSATVSRRGVVTIVESFTAPSTCL